MKKIALTSLMLLSLLIVKSQIQVSSSGHIGLSTSASTSYNLISGGSNYFTDYIGIGGTPDSNYKLKVSGNSYISGYLGIGTAPSSSYRLNLSGDSYFSGTTRLVGNTYFSGGNGYLSGDFYITGTTDGGPTLHVVSSSEHTPCAAFTGSSSFDGPYIVSITGDAYNYSLYVEGDSYSTGSWVGSDFQLKKNITVLNSAEMLAKIKGIEGKKYEFKSSKEIKELIGKTGSIVENDNFKSNLPEGIRYGFVAQDVESVFPELVKTDSVTKLKAVDYDGMIPVLLQCIKEQQIRIEALEASVNELTPTSKQSAPKRLASTSKTIDTKVGNILYQNTPNPFNQSTVIEYLVNESVSDAKICIYNMNGVQLKSIKITENGAGRITINSKDLKAGMYLYSLIADGSLVDTKKMVLTD